MANKVNRAACLVKTACDVFPGDACSFTRFLFLRPRFLFSEDSTWSIESFQRAVGSGRRWSFRVRDENVRERTW